MGFEEISGGVREADLGPEITSGWLGPISESPVASWLALHVETVPVKPARLQLPGGRQ
jgi:hypothetical protein